jgi:menaquinone-dependent protoporphyrinogen oxidase
MRVLVTWGSKRGGTEGIARIVGDTLRAQGFDVEVLPPRDATKAAGFDAAIVGGALYGNRWHRAARRFVTRRQRDLRRVPVWFFSSGPLDDSSEREHIPPTLQVQTLMERVGARGHVTFGGRLAPGARGFPASAMAKKHAGDWRSDAHIRSWAIDIAHALPTARPGPVVDQPGGSTGRLLVYGFVGWAACAAVMGALVGVSRIGIAVGAHAVAAPVIFTVVSWRYFRARGARDSMVTALTFVAIVALLDLIVVAGIIQRNLAMFGSVFGTWIPFALIFAVSWAVGEWKWMAPRQREAPPGLKTAS